MHSGAAEVRSYIHTRRVLYFELFVHPRPACAARYQQVRHVSVKVLRFDQSIPAQDGLHQSVMDEHILLLEMETV